MTEITINPCKEAITVKLDSQSQHVFGVFITVYDNDREKILEQYSGNFDKNKPYSRSLALNPYDAKDKYVDCFIQVLSVVRVDSFYSASISLMQGNSPVNTGIQLSGFTLYGEGSNLTHFHLNQFNRHIKICRQNVLQL
jgi:hypothetical protein